MSGDELAELVWNGVAAESGRYAFAPRTIAALADGVRTRAAPGDEHRKRIDARRTDRLALPPLVDVERLDKAGWGLVIPDGLDAAVEAALAPLVARREGQAKKLFKRLSYRAGQTIAQLRAAWHYSPGVVYPDVVPAYLLLVGGPALIPFAIEHALGADFMVGRLAFDTADEYARYAKALIASEDAPARPRRIAFFAPRNDDDRATLLSHDQLVEPLIADVDAPGVTKAGYLARDATRDRLIALLGDDAPAIMFAASHGMCCRKDDPDQRALQGALVTQEWPGPIAEPTANARWAVPASAIGASDVSGMVALLFACFGGGTPAAAEYAPVFAGDGDRLAPAPFVARLPQALLARGASAIIAHVERTWDTGFRWPGVTEPQHATLRSVVEAIAGGLRVGHAKWALGMRYTSLAADLDREQRIERDDKVPLPPTRRGYLFTATSDARAWVVLGDPAARVGMAAT